MGIKVEFNPDLALRDISKYKKGSRRIEECIPENLKVGEIYSFLKRDQRHYWLEGELPLVITDGNEALSRPKASIIITQVTHFIEDGIVYTKGKYRVVEIFNDDNIHFEGYSKVKPGN